MTEGKVKNKEVVTARRVTRHDKYMNVLIMKITHA